MVEDLAGEVVQADSEDVGDPVDAGQPEICIPIARRPVLLHPGRDRDLLQASGPNVRSISIGPRKVPALIGPATNSQNGVKLLKAARAGS